MRHLKWLISRLFSPPYLWELFADAISVWRGQVVVRALGRSNDKAKGDKVVLLEARHGQSSFLDLHALAPRRAEVLSPVYVGGKYPAPSGVRITPHLAGVVRLPLQSRASICLLKDPWSGDALISAPGFRQRLDLYGDTEQVIRVHIPGAPDRRSYSQPRLRPNNQALAEYYRNELARRTKRHRKENPAHQEATIALYTPRWRGVAAATKELFDNTLAVPLSEDIHPDDVDTSVAEAVADAILDAKFENVVLSGGDIILYEIARALRARSRHLNILLLWHSSYLQLGEGHDWKLLSPWLVGARTGIINRIGTVKRGMEQFFEALGVSSVFVQNVVRLRGARIELRPNNNEIGLWLSGSSEYRKPPYATICAVASIAGLRLRASGLDGKAIALASSLGLDPTLLSDRPLPPDELQGQIRRTAITAYVTLSECMPMLPLESIAAGVPAVVGPASHLFRDDPFLRSALVVERPTSPKEIRRKILFALEARSEIFERSIAYLRNLEHIADETLARFVAS